MLILWYVHHLRLQNAFFFGVHSEFCWVIFIISNWLEFWLPVCVFWQPFWIGILDFWFLTSWFNTVSLSVTLAKHCVDVLCLMELQLLVQSVAFERFYCPCQRANVSSMLGHCRDAVPAWNIVWYMYFNYVGGAQRVQVSSVASDKGPLLTVHPTWASLNRHWST